MAHVAEDAGNSDSMGSRLVGARKKVRRGKKGVRCDDGRSR